jgi:hypothetical protein
MREEDIRKLEHTLNVGSEIEATGHYDGDGEFGWGWFCGLRNTDKQDPREYMFFLMCRPGEHTGILNHTENFNWKTEKRTPLIVPKNTDVVIKIKILDSHKYQVQALHKANGSVLNDEYYCDYHAVQDAKYISFYGLRNISVNFKWGKPAKYLLTDIEYEMPNIDPNSIPPEALGRNYGINETALEQKTTIEVTSSTSETTSWNNVAGVEAGVETEVEAGIPLVAEGKIKVSAKTSYSHEWGGDVTETKEVKRSAEATVPPHSKMLLTLEGKKFVTDIDWTGTLTTHFENGETEVTKTRGKYYGVQVFDTRIVWHKAEPL